MWARIVEPWRSEAERRGFAFVARAGSTDHLRSRATWLDLEGTDQGFRAATLKTWIEAGEARFSLTTIGEAVPRPAGFFLGSIVAPLMRKLAPPESRPLLLRRPEDLQALFAKHTAELLAIAGKAVQHATLDERREQERRDSL